MNDRDQRREERATRVENAADLVARQIKLG